MCDYSIHANETRPAVVGDKLVVSGFRVTSTRGFSTVGEPDVAVCLLPGTELAFDEDIRINRQFFANTKCRTAIFRQVDTDLMFTHHDALELSNGKIVKLTTLRLGQHAHVLQMPVVDTPKKNSLNTLVETTPEYVDWPEHVD